MDLKDIIILLLIICIFGTLIFGSLGSFFYHVGEFIGHASHEAGATTDKFSVDYLEGKSPNSPSKHVQSDEIPNHKDYSVVDGSNSSKSSSSHSGDINSASSGSNSKSFEKYLGISDGSSGSSGGSSGSGSSGGSSGSSSGSSGGSSGSGSSGGSSGSGSSGGSSGSSSGSGSSGGFGSGLKSFEKYLGIFDSNSGSSSSGSGSSKGGYNVNPQKNSSNITNITNITNNTNNSVINNTYSNNTDNNTDSNKTTEYEDFQIDYATNMSDSQNNPIIRSIVSTSGGMVEPGIYEVYWSELGIINQTRIG